ncbi:hypothetical protein ABZU75_00215 [Streptosporangium sp. NPDC005286]|uniref:hypothetical protein n=1 Tax=Streptosporangium sp. NPDC005286 TaxID=3154463 RepID=UPI0033B590D7
MRPERARRRGSGLIEAEGGSFLHIRELGVDVSGMEDHERATLDRFHRWSLPELRSTAERVVPLGLAGLMERLLAGDIPREPVNFPWHHPDPLGWKPPPEIRRTLGRITVAPTASLIDQQNPAGGPNLRQGPAPAIGPV